MTQSQVNNSKDAAITRDEFDAMVVMFKSQAKKLDKLETENTELKRQLDWFRRQLFGSKSEKRTVDNPLSDAFG